MDEAAKSQRIKRKLDEQHGEAPAGKKLRQEVQMLKKPKKDKILPPFLSSSEKSEHRSARLPSSTHFPYISGNLAGKETHHLQARRCFVPKGLQETWRRC